MVKSFFMEESILCIPGVQEFLSILDVYNVLVNFLLPEAFSSFVCKFMSVYHRKLYGTHI